MYMSQDHSSGGRSRLPRKCHGERPLSPKPFTLDLGGPGAIRMNFVDHGRVRQAIQSARDEVLLTLAPSQTPVGEAVDTTAAQRAAAKGVAVHVYVPVRWRGTREIPESELVRLARVGAVIYTVSDPLPRMTIVDRSVVVAACNRYDYDDGGMIGRNLPFTSVIVQLLQVQRTRADLSSPGTGDTDTDQAVVEPLGREVLRQLVRGAKDEAAAREMDLALRTYRRIVARLMLGLGAKSRFQAGYLAARQGLLP